MALNPKQLQVATLLCSGASITSAAHDVDISRDAIHTWLKNDDAFIAHLNGLKRELIDAGRAEIQASIALAVTTINSIMACSENDAVRLAAAKEVLTMAGLTKPAGIGSDSAAVLKKARIKKAEFDAMFDDL